MTKKFNGREEGVKEVSKSVPKQPQSIVEFFRQSPLMGSGIDLERDGDPGRDIDFGIDELDEG